MARITWQSVLGPSLADAARPLADARQSFNSAFSFLNKAYDDRVGFQKELQNRQDEAKVQGFLDRLQTATTPEQLQALQASGELATLREGLERPEDLARIRGAEDARLNQIFNLDTAKRNNTLANWDFGDKELTRKYRDQVNQAEVLTAQGDYRGATDIVNKLPANLPGLSKIAEGVRTGERNNQRYIWEAEEAARKVEAENRAALLAPVQRQQLIAQTKAAGAAADAARLGHLERALVGHQSNAQKAADALTGHEENSVGGAGGKAVMDHITKLVPGQENAQLAMALVSEVLTNNPEYQKLPPSVAIQAITPALDNVKNSWFWGDHDSTIRDRMLDGLKKAFNNPETKKAMDFRDTKRKELVTSLEQARALAKATEDKLFPELAAAAARLAKP